ncbi:hypothetical protein [Leifsonia aquatica]|uniref:hypothetical protein n=1 Tax=Leifsonia aquatica TaxID=144185 RepID=UPI0004695681|nr:hypothetical protein [Leifsonia aquatica]
MSDDYNKLIVELREDAAGWRASAEGLKGRQLFAFLGAARMMDRGAATVAALAARDELWREQDASLRDDIRTLVAERDALRAELKTLADDFGEARNYIAAEAPHKPTLSHMDEVLTRTGAVIDPVEGEQP